jgi:acyl carrier protein
MSDVDSSKDGKMSVRRAQLISEVRTILIRRLSLRIQPTDFLEDMELFGKGLGLDSVDALEVAMAIETEFGIAVTDDDMAGLRSVGSIADFIISNEKGVERLNA